KLLNLKGKYGASNKFFTELLGLLKKMQPAGNEMVEKTYQDKKLMRMMGSGYKKIHVILYWKDNKELTVCPTCGISRWKVDNKTYKVYENISAKASQCMASFIYHIQPSSMVVYEKKVYHALGVDTYVASTKENFNPHVVVLWMINDYPALGTLSGCPYSGFKDYVVCGKDTYCIRLSTSSKQSYAGHRRYLSYNHSFKREKKAFNGQQEFQLALNPLIGEQIYNEV
nr:hypothetical protein [Tanacetum cinerariifolium]